MQTVAAALCLERVRTRCLALPGVSERMSHGEPAWFVRRQFVTMADHHHDDRFGFWAAAPEGAQQRWLAVNPDEGRPRFYYPPYVGARGWIGVYLDVPASWDDIDEIIDDAWVVVAPARLREKRRPGHDSGSTPPGAPSATIESIVSTSSTDLSGR